MPIIVIFVIVNSEEVRLMYMKKFTLDVNQSKDVLFINFQNVDRNVFFQNRSDSKIARKI